MCVCVDSSHGYIAGSSSSDCIIILAMLDDMQARFQHKANLVFIVVGKRSVLQ